MFTEKEILDQLDEPFHDLHAPSGPPWLVPPRVRPPHTFMLDLEHGYFKTAGSYIHLFADEERWAIVMEKNGYNTRGDCIESELVYFGNCVAQVGEYNMLMLPLIDTDEIEMREEDEEDYFELVAPEITEVKIREAYVPIENNAARLAELGITVREHNNRLSLVDFGSLARYLHAVNPDAIRANEDELRTWLPDDLPMLASIGHFHYESIYQPEVPPSAQETYQLLARMLVTRDVAQWKPTLPANNHWFNWESGHM